MESMAWRSINVVAVLIAAGSCASSSKPDTEVEQEPGFELCADSAARFTISGGGFSRMYAEFMRPLGRMFLIVDEDCRAWVGEDSWRDLRAADLSQEEAERLSATLRLPELAASPGRYAPMSCFDADTTQASGDQLDVSCYCNCDDGITPAAIRGLQTRVQSVITELSARAEPVGGALRIAVVRDLDFQERDPMWQPWPLEADIETFLESYPLDAEAGFTIDSEEDVALLRALRADYRALTGEQGSDTIPIDAGAEELYGLLIRDELPPALIE